MRPVIRYCVFIAITLALFVGPSRTGSTQTAAWPAELVSLLPDQSGLVVTVDLDGFEEAFPISQVPIGQMLRGSPLPVVPVETTIFDLFRNFGVDTTRPLGLATYGDHVFGHDRAFEQVVALLVGDLSIADAAEIFNQSRSYSDTLDPGLIAEFGLLQTRLESTPLDLLSTPLGLRVMVPVTDAVLLFSLLEVLIPGSVPADPVQAFSFALPEDLGIALVRVHSDYLVFDIIEAEGTPEDVAALALPLEGGTTTMAAPPSEPTLITVSVYGNTLRNLATVSGFVSIVGAIEVIALEDVERFSAMGASIVLNTLQRLWSVEDGTGSWTLELTAEALRLLVPLETSRFVGVPETPQLIDVPGHFVVQLPGTHYADRYTSVGLPTAPGTLDELTNTVMEGGLYAMLGLPALTTSLMLHAQPLLPEPFGHLAGGSSSGPDSFVLVFEGDDLEASGLVGAEGDSRAVVSVWLGCFLTGLIPPGCVETVVVDDVPTAAEIAPFPGLFYLSTLVGERPLLWLGDDEVISALASPAPSDRDGLALIHIDAAFFAHVMLGLTLPFSEPIQITLEETSEGLLWRIPLPPM